MLPMYPIYRRKKINAGFTLLEMVLVIGLVSILLGAVTMTFVVGLSVGDVGMTAGGVRNQASYSLRVISEELRQAIAVTTADLHTLTFQALTFQTDPASDRVSGEVVPVTYSWSGTSGDNLVRTQVTPRRTTTTILAHGVQNASFQYYYYDSNNTAPFPVTASAVKVVQLTLRVAKQEESVQYEIKIGPRGIPTW